MIGDPLPIARRKHDAEMTETIKLFRKRVFDLAESINIVEISVEVKFDCGCISSFQAIHPKEDDSDGSG